MLISLFVSAQGGAASNVVDSLIKITVNLALQVGDPVIENCLNPFGGPSEEAAPDEWVTLLGSDLAESTLAARDVPLPESLGATTVSVGTSDSVVQTEAAPLRVARRTGEP